MTSLPNNQASSAPVECKRPPVGQFTDRRAKNFAAIIEMLRTGSQTRAQVATALNLDVRQASKYLSDLGRAGVTRFTSQLAGGVGRVVTHRISTNVEAVDCFIARLGACRKSSPVRIRVSDDPTRHFHLIFSGAMIHPEPAAAPEPDPLALPASFFRPARLDDEPMPRATVAQVARASFPVASSYKFELAVV